MAHQRRERTSARTIVITGGTDGMGRALALHFLRRGDIVVIVGRTPAKGQALLDAAVEIAASDRAFFFQADLGSMKENRRVVDAITTKFPIVDVLVLCARHFRSTRLVTEEGFEDTLATFYFSRFIFSHGLANRLEKADKPVVMNISAPGEERGEVHWDDLTLEQGYNGFTALGQAGKANDLLGVAFAETHGAGPIRYVLFHPGLVAGSFSGEYDEATEQMISEIRKTATPVEDAIKPILAAIDAPPAEPLSAFAKGAPLALAHESFDRTAAKRLDALTRELLSPYLVLGLYD